MLLVSRIVAAFVLAVAGFQLATVTRLRDVVDGDAARALLVVGLVVVGGLVGWIAGGWLAPVLRRRLQRVGERPSERTGPELVVGAGGLMLGLVVSALLSIPLARIETLGPYLLLPVTLVVAWSAAELFASRHRDILHLFGVDVEDEAALAAGRPKLLDVSTLVDGRVADVVASGFLEGELVVPVFVLEELQRIADDAGDVRSAHGRRGLKVVTRLRTARRLATTEDDAPGVVGVEARVVEVARRTGRTIVTADGSVAAAAAAAGVDALNLNELANALKPEFVPGEQISIKLVREGREPGQGVGYLDDGTMVIVDQGSDRVGATVDVEVASTLQSPSGKLVFTKLRKQARQ